MRTRPNVTFIRKFPAFLFCTKLNKVGWGKSNAAKSPLCPVPTNHISSLQKIMPHSTAREMIRDVQKDSCDHGVWAQGCSEN